MLPRCRYSADKANFCLMVTAQFFRERLRSASNMIGWGADKVVRCTR